MSKAEQQELQDRIERLEGHVAQLAGTMTSARALLADSRRIEELAARARQLSAGADAALLALGERAAASGAGLPRLRPALGAVHRAEATGYVSIFFTGGRTDTLKLLVGWDDPPTECICEANTRNDLNAYAGGIVRKGEYWTVVGRSPERSGFECVFTPLF
ncbi:MAG: hypothetical protein ACRDOI_03975 [Trebonia sp.]